MFGLRGIIFILISVSGSGLSLFRPYLGMLALGVLYFFRPDVYGLEEFVTPVKWLTVSILIGYLASRRSDPVFKNIGWMVLMLLMYLFSTIFGAHSNIQSWETLWLIFKVMVAVFLIEKVCNTPARLAGFVLAMLVGCLYFVKVAIFAWRQANYGDMRVEAVIGQGGGSNYIAWVLAATIGFLYYKAIFGKGWQRITAITMIPMWVVGIMATGSRGGLLCLLAASAVFLITMRKFMLLFATGAAVMIFLAMAPQAYMQRMETITLDPQKMDTSAFSRYQNFQIGKAIIKDYPIFGTGLDTFPQVKRSYLPPDYIGSIIHVAHNTYIQMGSELGLPFLGTFLVVTLLAAMRLTRRLPDRTRPAQQYLDWVRVGTLSALAATYVQMVKGDVAHMDFFWWLHGLAYTCHHLRNSALREAAQKIKIVAPAGKVDSGLLAWEA